MRAGGTCLELPPPLTELEDPPPQLLKLQLIKCLTNVRQNTNITAYKILLRKTLHS